MQNRNWQSFWGLLVLLAVFCGGLFVATPSYAAPGEWETSTPLVTHDGKNMCPDRSDGLLGRVVQCIQQIVIEAVVNFLDSVLTFLRPIILATLVLAVTLYGALFLSGSTRKPSSDTFILAMKIGGVGFFLLGTPFGGMVKSVFDVMDGLVHIVSSYALVSPTLGFCSDTSTFPQDVLDLGARAANFNGWDKVDCMLASIFGINIKVKEAVGPITLFGGVLFSGGIGLMITILGIFFILMLLITILRGMKVYLTAVIALAFLICVSPITIPCVLFRTTSKFFQNWLNSVICNILIPVFIMAYIAMMVAAVDALIFRGPSSLYYAVASKPSQEKEFIFNEWLFSGKVGTTEVGKDVPGTEATVLMGYRNICNNGDEEAKKMIEQSVPGICGDDAKLVEQINCASNPYVANENADVDLKGVTSCTDIANRLGANGHSYYGFMKTTQLFNYSLTPDIETDADKRAQEEEDANCNFFCWVGNVLGSIVGFVVDVISTVVGWIATIFSKVLEFASWLLKGIAKLLHAPCQIMPGIMGDVCNFFADAAGSILNFAGDVVHAVGAVVSFTGRLLLDGIWAALGLDHIDGWFEGNMVDLQKIASYRCKMENPGSYSALPIANNTAYLTDCPGVGDLIMDIFYVVITAVVVMYLLLSWLPMLPIIAFVLTNRGGVMHNDLPGEHLLSDKLAHAAGKLRQKVKVNSPDPN